MCSSGGSRVWVPRGGDGCGRCPPAPEDTSAESLRCRYCPRDCSTCAWRLASRGERFGVKGGSRVMEGGVLGVPRRGSTLWQPARRALTFGCPCRFMAAEQTRVHVGYRRALRPRRLCRALRAAVGSNGRSPGSGGGRGGRDPGGFCPLRAAAAGLLPARAEWQHLREAVLYAVPVLHCTVKHV